MTGRRQDFADVRMHANIITIINAFKSMSWHQDAEVRDTKGLKCKCGYMTVSQKLRCPKCGKQMRPAIWEDKGKVLSFTSLNATPVGLSGRYNLALVEIEDGPKMACWTLARLKANEIVAITHQDGKYICSPESARSLELGQDSLKA